MGFEACQCIYSPLAPGSSHPTPNPSYFGVYMWVLRPLLHYDVGCLWRSSFGMTWFWKFEHLFTHTVRGRAFKVFQFDASVRWCSNLSMSLFYTTCHYLPQLERGCVSDSKSFTKSPLLRPQPGSSLSLTVHPISTSLWVWMNYLRLKTGIA